MLNISGSCERCVSEMCIIGTLPVSDFAGRISSVESSSASIEMPLK